MLIYSLSSWLVLVARGLALGCLWLEFGAHLAPFGLPLDPLGAPWGPSGVPWGPLGLPWGPHGVPGESLGVLWVSLGGPLGVPRGSLGGPLEVPWGALGCTGRFSEICRKLDAQFRAKVSILQCLRIESSLPVLCTQSRQSPGSRGSGIWTAARCPPSSRRGPG